MRSRLLLATATTLAALIAAAPAPQAQSPSPAAGRSDLDAFMKQVLTRRDDNWKKLQQYTLEEDETLQISALNGRKLYGFRREYSWYPQDDGMFVRSPISADGVKISEEERRKAEASWLKREESREKARLKREAERNSKSENPNPESQSPETEARSPETEARSPETEVQGLQDLVSPGAQPQFVSSAYFMKFKFDEGSYALVGREKLLGRDVLRIEYYPRRFFQDDSRDRPNNRDKAQQKKDDIGDRIEQKMDKVSMVTMWIEPTEHQILQYEFTNIDFDFLPGRALVRLDDLRAGMKMREAFPGVWLPDTVAMSFGMSLALGEVAAKYDVKYHEYKLAEVKARVR